MARYYKLVGRLPVLCSMLEYAAWMMEIGGNFPSVASTTVGDMRVSTVFLASDLSYRDGHALLFETMILNCKVGFYIERSETWGEAEQEHARAVEVAQGLLDAAKGLDKPEGA
jgi:hypothetical protein